MNIDFKSYLDNIKLQLTTGAYAELSKSTVFMAEYLKDLEIRFADLAAGAASGDLSYAFVVKALSEEPKNIEDAILSIASSATAEAETLAQGAVFEFERFLREQIIAKS